MYQCYECAVISYLQVLLLVRVRIHKHTQTREVILVPKHRTCEEHTDLFHLVGSADVVVAITEHVSWVKDCVSVRSLNGSTVLHAFLVVPNSQAIPVQILLALAVNLEVDL